MYVPGTNQFIAVCFCMFRFCFKINHKRSFVSAIPHPSHLVIGFDCSFFLQQVACCVQRCFSRSMISKLCSCVWIRSNNCWLTKSCFSMSAPCCRSFAIWNTSFHNSVRLTCILVQSYIFIDFKDI